MAETERENDVVADAAVALEQAETGDDEARLAALDRAHAALEDELERPAPDTSAD